MKDIKKPIWIVLLSFCTESNIQTTARLCTLYKHHVRWIVGRNTKRFIQIIKDIQLQPDKPLQLYLEHFYQTACKHPWEFTFSWDVDEHWASEFSKLFFAEHSAPNPHLMIDVSLKPVKGALCAPGQVNLWGRKGRLITSPFEKIK